MPLLLRGSRMLLDSPRPLLLPVAASCCCCCRTHLDPCCCCCCRCCHAQIRGSRMLLDSMQDYARDVSAKLVVMPSSQLISVDFTSQKVVLLAGAHQGQRTYAPHPLSHSLLFHPNHCIISLKPFTPPSSQSLSAHSCECTAASLTPPPHIRTPPPPPCTRLLL